MGNTTTTQPYLFSLVKLLRPAHWVKNLFIFIPVFFSGRLASLTDLSILTDLLGGWLAFGLVASSVYVLNDWRDRGADRLHPVKSARPLASGAITPAVGLTLMVICAAAGLLLAYWLRDKFAFILLIYLALNVAYCFGLKNISILDVLIVAIGFVLRVKAGGALAEVFVTPWLTVMVYLLALFLAFAKRRDDLLLKLSTGQDMRKAIKGYNLEFVNLALGLLSAVISVAYLLYCVSPDVEQRLGGRVYYTFLFVLAGLLRYLQLTYVLNDSGSPVKLLYRDRFIQVCLVAWVISFYAIIYYRDIRFFD
jgi:decaprenyl-phosphate phosphoribosyltransferase